VMVSGLRSVMVVDMKRKPGIVYDEAACKPVASDGVHYCVLLSRSCIEAANSFAGMGLSM